MKETFWTKTACIFFQPVRCELVHQSWALCVCVSLRASVWWSWAICILMWACCSGAAAWCGSPIGVCVQPMFPCWWWPSPWSPGFCWQRNLNTEVNICNSFRRYLSTKLLVLWQIWTWIMACSQRRNKHSLSAVVLKQCHLKKSDRYR